MYLHNTQKKKQGCLGEQMKLLVGETGDRGEGRKAWGI